MSDEVRRWFQWILGERRDDICIFDHVEEDDGEIYVVFTDKSRINEKYIAQLNSRDLSGKFVAEIDHPNNKWQFREKVVADNKPRFEKDANSGVDYEVPPVDEVAHADITGQSGTTRPGQKPKNKIIDLIPPKPTPPSHSVFGAIRRSMTPVQPQVLNIPETTSTNKVVEKKIDISDPVYILMQKSKKTDTEISMNITISLPSKSLYNIAKESFDNAQEKFVEYILEDVTVDKIKEALKIAITEMYESDDNDITKNNRHELNG